MATFREEKERAKSLRKAWFYAGIGRRRLMGSNRKGEYQPRKAGDIEMPKLPQPRRFIGNEPRKFFL